MEHQNLHQHSKKNPFIVPDNYFENFEQQLSDKLNLDKKVNKTIFFYSKYYVAAAAITIFLCISIFMFQPSSKIINPQELDAYFEYQNSFGLSDEIISGFNQEDLSDLENTIHLNQTEINEYVLGNIDLEYYLNDL
jgi:hypothetical protein